METKINIKELKEKLSAKVVAEKYLGEPTKVIGKACYYPSPFKENAISGCPFQVTDTYMKDWSGGFSGDVLSFVAELHQVSLKEAIDIIAIDFAVKGLELPSNASIVSNVGKKKVEKVMLEVGTKPEVITTMFDQEAFKAKPTQEEISKIKMRIQTLQLATYSLEGMKSNIINGYTCIPAGIKDNGEENWKQQQVFMVDIDNTIKVDGKNEKVLSTDPRHITVEKVIDFCGNISLLPTFVYTTFSHSNDCHRLRLVYVLEKPTSDIEIAKGVYSLLKEKLNSLNIDEAPTNLESLLFGGTSIVYEGTNFYNAVKKEIDLEEVEYKVCTDYGENWNPYVKKLEENGYCIKDGNVCTVEEKIIKGNVYKTYTKLCNVLPVISGQTTYFNGCDSITNYVVKGLLLKENKELPSVTVSKEDLEKAGYFINPLWNIQAVKAPVRDIEKSIWYMSQLTSKDTIKCDTVYAHTGFMRLPDGKLIYLYHGGIIGEAENITVDLSRDALESYSFTEKEFDIKEALQTSYSIIDVAEPNVSIPLLATTYLSPLRSILNENNILTDHILWMEGKTQIGKSSLSAVVLSHFGEFKRDTFPCSFLDTANSLEKKAYILKDTLQMIDDYHPEVVKTGKLGTAERLFAMFGDRTGRGRMRSDGQSLRNAYTSRGLCLVTGESFPEVSQSRTARAFIVEMQKGSVDFKKLRTLQEDTGKLSFAMKAFIKWVIKNEKEIISNAKEIKKRLEIQEETMLQKRTKEAIDGMIIGFSLFLEFLKENDIITQQELEEKMILCSETLIEMGKEQSLSVEEQNPIPMFIGAIEQLYESGKIDIMNYSIPCNVLSGSTLIGYVDLEKEMYYFLPDNAYNEVRKFYSQQGIKFPVSKSALWKYLDNEGYLYRTGKSDRRTVKKKLPNKNVTLPVIAIYQDKFGIEFNKIDMSGKLQEEIRERIIKEQKELKNLKEENHKE